MKVLLVDDENYILEYLSHVVDWKSRGFEQISRATSGAEAKNLLLAESFELLITDIRMPEVNGLDLITFVNEQKLATVVYFLSGYSEFEYAQQAIRFGLADYLLKPLTQKKLEEALNRFNDLYQIKKKTSEQKLVLVEKTVDLENNDVQKIILYLKKYVREHLAESLSLNSLADLVYLNPSYLSTLYKKETGENISVFILQERMKRASQLLADTQLRIADISQMVGYKKTQYFGELFRKEYRMTPQQYRRKRLME